MSAAVAQPSVWLSLIGLWLAVGYLFGLGVAALLAPARASRFLMGFAQTPRANFAEASLRGLVGLAFIGADSYLGARPFGTLAGMFLIGTGVLMLLFPAAHRSIAQRTVPWATERMWLVGTGAVAMALVLGSLLTRPLLD